MDEVKLTHAQREALVMLAGVPEGAAFVPTLAQRPAYHELVALGLARSCGPGLGGEGFAPTPDGRRRHSIVHPKAYRGFARLSPERRRQVAAMGGGAVAPDKRAFSKDRALATRAGRLGGETSPKRGRPQHRGE
ncbi:MULTISPECIES: hypothetical protein [Phenylobacterium]|uniref:General stress protein YciG n=1 Tax=Phenylobacterium koreense TaxID=266125 RepID=A0ABV2ELS1_9CAUL